MRQEKKLSELIFMKQYWLIQHIMSVTRFLDVYLEIYTSLYYMNLVPLTWEPGLM